MPNWCYNSLMVDADNKSNLNAFRRWLDKDGFKLNKILPMPKELEDTTSPVPADQVKLVQHLVEKYGAAEWYTWRVNNWGTKWDVDAEIDENEYHVLITFESAWSPPVYAITALGKLFPELTFTLAYKEEGMGYAGELTVHGDDVHDFCINSSDDKEGYRNFCINEFDTDPFEHEDEEVVS